MHDSCHSHFSTCTSCTSCTQTVTGSGTFQTFPRPGTKIPQRGINKTWRFLGISPHKMAVAVAVVLRCKKCRRCNFFFSWPSKRARETFVKTPAITTKTTLDYFVERNSWQASIEPCEGKSGEIILGALQFEGWILHLISNLTARNLAIKKIFKLAGITRNVINRQRLLQGCRPESD